MSKIISASQWQIDLQHILISYISKVTPTNKVYLPFPGVELPKRRILIQVIEFLVRMLSLKTVQGVQVASANMELLAQHKTYLEGTMVMIKVKIKLLINHMHEKFEMTIFDWLYIINLPHLIDDKANY